MLVSQLSDSEIFDQVKAAIDGAYISLIFKYPDISIYNATVNGVTDWIQNSLPNFQVENINKAFQIGILGDYGEFHGLSQVSFIKFLKGYDSATKRSIPLTQEKEERPVPSPQEQFKTLGDMAISEYNSYGADKFGTSKKPYIFNSPRLACIYDFINSLGLITYDKSIKLQLYAQAKVNVADRLSAKKQAAGDKFLRDAISSMIERFDLGPEKDSKEEKEMITEGKALTVVKFFDDVILTKANLTGLIEGKRQVFYDLKNTK